jgi:hypothetical protein
MEDVEKQVAEPTVQEEATTSEPTEEVAQTDDTQPTQADESNQSDDVVKTVPYDRFKEVNDEVKYLREQVANVQPPVEQPYVPELEEESARAVKQTVLSTVEEIRAAEFERKHADELKDPLLSSRVQAIIRENNSKGQVIDQEAALSQANKELEARINPAIKQAKQDGVKAGQETAHAKEQAGAVGDTNRPKVDVDPSGLSAEEYAKYYGLKRLHS